MSKARLVITAVVIEGRSQELSYAGLLLRATETYAEYTEDRVRRVFEALAPALPPGVAEPIYGYEHMKLVHGVNAADRR